MSLLTKDFYARDTLLVAKELLGCVLCRKDGNTIYKGIIVETEAYTEDEPSCHAYNGPTKRSLPLFGEAGTAYVYFVYGMHHCMNIVTDKKGFGSAVLIRALEPLGETERANGPALLCKALKITTELNGISMTEEASPLWVEKGKAPTEIVQTTRIGITKAADYPWRFYIKDSPFVSKK